MQSGNCRVGAIGEAIAVKYLTQKGWVIIKRNVQIGGVEIDIVACDSVGDHILVEVKTLSGNRSLLPEDNMTGSKLERLYRAAQFYSNANLQDASHSVRVDCVCVCLQHGHENKVLTEAYKSCQIRHYENI